MAKRGLSHIALKVRDLKKTEDFYVENLGLKVAFRNPPSMIFLTTPGSGDLLNFVKTAQRSKPTKASNISASKSPSGIEKARSKNSPRQASISTAAAAKTPSTSAIPMATRLNITATDWRWIAVLDPHPIVSLSRSKQTQLILPRPAKVFGRQLRPAVV